MSNRTLHQIDGYRVVFEPGEGWKCECADFNASDCEHVHEARVLRNLELASERLALN